MLKTKDLIENVDEKYIPMLEQVNIPNFTKCIAVFSGLKIKELSDDIIKHYLLQWAENKYYIYKYFGTLRIDKPFDFLDVDPDRIEDNIEALKREYPIYSLWLEGFVSCSQNKITREQYEEVRYGTRNAIENYFPRVNIIDMNITTFFKRYLSAPDELVTAIGRIFENNKIKGMYTLSIDPVDMMLASENPYKWTSCYSLDHDHADGTLAAVLDSSSMVSYLWEEEGNFKISNEGYEMKNVRFKRLRQTIATDRNFCLIHFNSVYPHKGEYPELNNKLREVALSIINKDGQWKGYNELECIVGCKRKYPYGYSEYCGRNIMIDVNKVFINRSNCLDLTVFDTSILCPCGCGNYLPGSDWEDENGNEIDYNGDGFIYENFEFPIQEFYCEYCDDYCDTDECSEEVCSECIYWKDAHPVCNLDGETQCEEFDFYDGDDRERVYGGHIEPDSELDKCINCPLHKLCHAEGADDESTSVDNDSEPASAESFITTNTISVDNHYTIRHISSVDS